MATGTLPTDYDPTSKAFITGTQMFTPASDAAVQAGTQAQLGPGAADTAAVPEAAPTPVPPPAVPTAPPPAPAAAPAEPQAIGRTEAAGVEAGPAPTVAAAKADPEDKLYEQILNMGLDEMFGKDYVSQLQERAAGKGLRPDMSGRQKFETIANAVSSGLQPPREREAALDRDMREQQNAVNTLAQMQGQLNTYKREAIRQRSAETRGEATAQATMNRTMAREMMGEMNKIQTEASALGVVLPKRPDWKELSEDPDLGTVWQQQASEIMGPRKAGLVLLQQQLPLYTKMAQNVNAAPPPGAMKAMWRKTTAAAGFSEDDHARLFAAQGEVLEGEAANARSMGNARKDKISAQIASLKTNDSLKADREARLADAMQNNDEFKASIALRDLQAQQQRMVKEQNAHAQAYLAAASESIDPRTGVKWADETARADFRNQESAYLTTLDNQIKGNDAAISKWRTLSFQKFGRDIWQVANDSSQRVMQRNAAAIQAGFSAAAAKNPKLTLDAYLLTNDPAAHKFRQDFLSEIYLTQPPEKVQAMIDTVGVDMLKTLEEQHHYTAADLAQQAASQPTQTTGPTAPAAGLPRK